MSVRPVRMVIENGVVRMVHRDGLMRTIQELGGGTVTVKRASHVEWCNDSQSWYADMSPVGGPMLNGYDTREAALEAEQDWLYHNGY